MTNTVNNIQLIPGPQGEQGLQGLAGEDGQDGINGKSAYELWLDEGNSGTIQDFLNSLIGPQGIPGTNGIDGLNGADGQPGAKGDKGDQGVQGIQGEQGPKGETGIQGIQGEIGLTGSQGEQGVKGDKGDVGPMGPQGQTGATGDTGTCTCDLSQVNAIDNGIFTFFPDFASWYNSQDRCINGQLRCLEDAQQKCVNYAWVTQQTCTLGCTDGNCNQPPKEDCTKLTVYKCQTTRYTKANPIGYCKTDQGTDTSCNPGQCLTKTSYAWKYCSKGCNQLTGNCN